MLMGRDEGLPPVARAAAWVPAAVWYRVIWGLSAQTAEVSDEVSDRLLFRMLAVVSRTFRQADPAGQAAMVEMLSFWERKAAHMFLYFVLVLLLLFAVSALGRPRKLPGRAAAALGSCAVLAALDEYHQSFVPGRSCELRDVLVDLSGAAIALGLFALAEYALRRRKRRR